MVLFSYVFIPYSTPLNLNLIGNLLNSNLIRCMCNGRA